MATAHSSSLAVGYNRCWNPEEDIRVATGASTYTFSGSFAAQWPGVGIGYGDEEYSKPMYMFGW